MVRGKNSKKRNTKVKKKGNTKKKGGVYQMGGENTVEHYTATYDKDNIDKGIIVMKGAGGDGSGAVGGDTFTKIGEYFMAEYKDTTTPSNGFNKITDELKKELEVICTDGAAAVASVKGSNPTKFSDLLNQDASAAAKSIILYTHSDNATNKKFISVQRAQEPGLKAVLIKIGKHSGDTIPGADTSMDGKGDDASITENTIYVISTANPTFK